MVLINSKRSLTSKAHGDSFQNSKATVSCLVLVLNFDFNKYTVSSYFTKVLDVLVKLHQEVISLPRLVIPSVIREDTK
jgi:hypothetical protein